MTNNAVSGLMLGTHTHTTKVADKETIQGRGEKKKDRKLSQCFLFLSNQQKADVVNVLWHVSGLVSLPSRAHSEREKKD